MVISDSNLSVLLDHSNQVIHRNGLIDYGLEAYFLRFVDHLLNSERCDSHHWAVFARFEFADACFLLH